MARAYCRTRKMPKMLASPGMITPPKLFTRPSDLMRRKRGSIATCTGIASPAASARKVASRPRKRSFAKAYPADALIASAPMVVTVAISALFSA